MFQNKAITLFLLVVGSASAANYCPNVPVTFVAGTSDNAEGMEETFELFRELLGGINNGNNVDPNGFPDGHRQVNWDAAGVPFDMPGDFFSVNVPRGLVVESSSEKFAVSNPSNPPNGDDKFSSINENAANKFKTFSTERLFTPLDNNKFEVEWTVPGQPDVEATVEGFGAVFVDVGCAQTTKMTFYAESGCIIAEKYVDPKENGLSFLGAYSGSEEYPIFEVEVTLGNRALNSWFSRWADFVVMDDFIFSEPQAI